MANSPTIRATTDADLSGLMRLYPAAFPDEDLRPLVTELLQNPDVLSLVAEIGGGLCGHVMFTIGDIAPSGTRAALLGPLAVTPPRQKQGLGRALVENGHARLTEQGIATVCVLGDPGYYNRLGFAAETGIEPPYSLPEEWRGAWQSQPLSNAKSATGTLSLPSAWMHPELWGP